MLMKNPYVPFVIALLVTGTPPGDCIEKQKKPTPSRPARTTNNTKKAKVKTESEAKSTFYIFGDYLFWRPNEDGLGYVDIHGFTPSSPLNRDTLKNPHFEWDSGFRVGAGYRMPHDHWDVLVKWTQFSSDAAGKVTGTNDTLLVPLFTNSVSADFFFNNPLTEITAKWKLHLHLIDAELSRLFKATRFLSLRPFAGMRGAWIDQNYAMHYKGGIIFSASSMQPPISVLQTNTVFKYTFKGLGLRIGLNSDWKFSDQWNLYANAGTSLLYGNFHLKDKETQATVDAPILVQIEKASNRVHQNAFMLDLATGIQWHYLFSNNRTALYFAVGWEFNDFFDQNKLFRPVFIPETVSLTIIQNHEDLTTQGLVASAKLDF